MVLNLCHALSEDLWNTVITNNSSEFEANSDCSIIEPLSRNLMHMWIPCVSSDVVLPSSAQCLKSGTMGKADR